MKTHFDIEKIIEQGIIQNELDYQRALIANRKLRLLAKDSVHFENLRHKLVDLIAQYEEENWVSIANVSDEQVLSSDKYELLAEHERMFINNRKQKIKVVLKENGLTQADLGLILGHKSKTHMSELMNGIKPFTLKDLRLIHRLFKIELTDLIPVFLSVEEQIYVKSVLQRLNKSTLRLEKEDLQFA